MKAFQLSKVGILASKRMFPIGMEKKKKRTKWGGVKSTTYFSKHESLYKRNRRFVDSWNFMIRSVQNPEMEDLWKLAFSERIKEQRQRQSSFKYAPKPHRTRKSRIGKKFLKGGGHLLAPVALLAMLAVISRCAVPAYACYCTTASFVTWSDDYHLPEPGFCSPFYYRFRF